MTSEQYAIIVDHALRLLGKLPARDLRKIEPWLTRKHVDWATRHKDPQLEARAKDLEILGEGLEALKRHIKSRA